MLRSVRGRLLASLLAVVSVALLVQGAVAYRNALQQTDESFDEHLERTAWSLARGTPVFGGPAGEPGAGAADDDLLIQIWSGDGVRIYRSAPRIVLPEQIVLGLSTVETTEATYRMYSVRTSSRIIQVGQDVAVRRQTARALVWRTVLPIAFVGAAMMLAVWWAVGAALAPIERVRRAVSRRQPGDLSVIDERPVPDEIRPLVSDMNQLLARMDQALGAQRQFVADAAHELRTPLTALGLQLGAARRAGDAAASQQAMQRLAAGLARARRLVEQLLDLARQDAAPPQPARMLDLSAVVREAIGDALPTAQARNIDLGVVRDESVHVQATPDGVRAVLDNLLDNAIKYGREGGRIDIGMETDARGGRLWVDDDGPGIPAAERARVFERFVRLDASAGEGSGLGLAIVRAVAAREGFTVQLAQAPELGGLRVELRFRQQAVQDEPPVSTHPS